MTYPGRRPVTVRWAAMADAGDPGDAGTVSAEIEAWLARHPPADADAAGLDRARALGGLRDGLARLVRDPRLARDPAFRACLADLPARADDPDALFAGLAELLGRAERLAGQSAGMRADPHPGGEGDVAAPRARRMILRL
jgi:hypothetical protein